MNIPSVQSLKNYGNELFTQRKWTEAIRVYTKILNHKEYKHVNDDDLSIDLLLLKQSTYLMRGRANANAGRIDYAKKDFDNCINILDSTKYAFKAKLCRSKLKIDNVEHWKRSKRDLQSIINVSKC